jgi:hypothetical protein
VELGSEVKSARDVEEEKKVRLEGDGKSSVTVVVA